MHSHGSISQQAIDLLNYVPMPNIPVTNVAGQNFNYHLQTNLPGLSNRLNVNVSHQISSKLSLQVNYNLSNGTSHSLSSFPGIEGNSFTRGQSLMLGLTQNWTRTFMHTSQLYFSRSRSLGLNEFSNVTDVGAVLGLTGISTNPFDYGLPQVSFTNFTGLSDPESLAESQPDLALRGQSALDERQAHHQHRRRNSQDGYQSQHRSRSQRPVCIYGADDQPVDFHRHSRRISVRLPDGYPLGTLHRQRFRGFPSRLACQYKSAIRRYRNLFSQLGLRRLRLG